VVARTDSDTDENILYWNDHNGIMYNSSCTGSDGECLGPINCSENSNGFDRQNFIIAMAGALYGRQEVTTRIRVKRRLREREALFLLTQYVFGLPNCDQPFDWPIRRTVYHRYAVRVAR